MQSNSRRVESFLSVQLYRRKTATSSSQSLFKTRELAWHKKKCGMCSNLSIEQVTSRIKQWTREGMELVYQSASRYVKYWVVTWKSTLLAILAQRSHSEWKFTLPKMTVKSQSKRRRSIKSHESNPSNSLQFTKIRMSQVKLWKKKMKNLNKNAPKSVNTSFKLKVTPVHTRIRLKNKTLNLHYQTRMDFLHGFFSMTFLSQTSIRISLLWRNWVEFNSKDTHSTLRKIGQNPSLYNLETRDSLQTF